MRRIKEPNKNCGKNISISQKNSNGVDNQTFTFSLEYVQKNYCFEKLNKDEKAAVISSIFKRSQLTWRQLRQSPRHALGIEEISRKYLKVKIPDNIPFVSKDTVFHAIRFCGKKPMVGFRYERVFYILWFDREFKLYDHG